MTLLRLSIKTGITGGVIYYTVQEGLWSTPEESIKFYEKVYNSTCPYVKKHLPVNVINEIPLLPSMSDIDSLFCRTWNKGVMVSIKFISELPTHGKSGLNMIQTEIKKRNITASTSENVSPITQ